MYTWSTAQIRALALRNEGYRSRLSLIKSEPVAREIAARVLQALIAKDVSEDRALRVVRMGVCPRFQGTWMVGVSLPGMWPPRTPERVYTQEHMQGLVANRNGQLQLVLDALRASYSATDLVTTWTGKHPPVAP